MNRKRLITAAVLLLMLAGAGLWIILGQPSTDCTPKPNDPEQYLLRICEYIRANEIDVRPGDPNGYTIKASEEREQNGRPVIWVFLSCCYMGDIAIIDKESGAVLDVMAGAQ